MTTPETPRATPASMKDRILDAAARCLVDGGFADNRLLTTIARFAGLSRPTLYKHGGTLEEIKSALLERETAAFMELVRVRVEATSWTADDVVDTLVAVIGHARGHPLLRAALRDAPEVVLPWFTTDAAVVVEMARAQVAPVVTAAIERGDMPALDVDVLVDLLARIVLSMVFTTSGVDADDPEALRTYLHAVVRVTVAAPLALSL